MKREQRRLAGLCLLLGLGAPVGASAQPAAGGEFRVNGSTTGMQFTADVAMDANGDFIVVWQDGSDLDGDGYGIRQRRFTSQGVPKAGGFGVNTFTTGHQRWPAVAADARGNFVVVWASRDQDGDSYGIFGQRYDSSGNKIGSEFQVNGYTTSLQVHPDVAVDGAGNFVVVWTTDQQDGSGYGIRGKRYDAGGVPLDSGFRVNTHTTGNQSRPAVSADANGNFVVVWQGSLQDGSGNGVFGQRYDDTGTPQGGEFRVNAYITGEQLHADVSVHPTGPFVVVWESGGQDGDSYGIRARVYDSGGSPVSGGFAVNSHTTDAQSEPAVTWIGSSFAVVWTSTGQDGSDSGVFVQRFDTSGNGQGESRVNSYTTDGQLRQVIASDLAGDFVVVWDSLEQDGSDYGIFGQRYGDLIFREDFEAGGLSRWTTAANGGADLSVTGAAALDGSGTGLQAFVDDTAALYVQDDSPDAEGRYRARFYLDPNGFDPGEAAGKLRVRIFIAFNGSSQRMATIVLRRLGGAYSLMGRVRRDDGTRADTGFFPITNAAHSVEFEWRRSSGPGANTGEFRLWIDGALLSTLLAIDNDLASVESARLGVMTIKTGAAGGTLYFDQFESRRLNPIGP